MLSLIHICAAGTLCFEQAIILGGILGNIVSVFLQMHIPVSYTHLDVYKRQEDDIAALEQQLEDLDNEMAANATNAAKLRELVEENEAYGALYGKPWLVSGCHAVCLGQRDFLYYRRARSQP